MARYSLEIKPSAGKELDALDDALLWVGGVCAQSWRGLEGVERGWKKLVTDSK